MSKVLRQRAMEDSLTHLYHAGAFKGLVERKLAKMKDGQLGAFWIMDLDNFKEFNDQYGHQTGDEILRQFAHLLERSLRGDGIMARIGGDEFAAYLDVVENQEEILALRGRIRDGAHSIKVEDKYVTISIGAVSVHPQDQYEILYCLADGALYEAKRKQKDQYCIAEQQGQRGSTTPETYGAGAHSDLT